MIYGPRGWTDDWGLVLMYKEDGYTHRGKRGVVTIWFQRRCFGGYFFQRERKDMIPRRMYETRAPRTGRLDTTWESAWVVVVHR